MYETFEHTADLGLRVQACDLNTLFAQAGRGLFSILVDNLEAVRPEQEVSLHVDGTEYDYLFVDWLSELLYQFESQHLLLTEFSVTVDESGLNAHAKGETVDPERHHLAHEVKAITYHGLKVAQIPEGWIAEVIVDI